MPAVLPADTPAAAAFAAAASADVVLPSEVPSSAL
jgi:hypothetical protein